MGNICSCDESGAKDTIHGNELEREAALRRKDPIIQELHQHLKLISQKMENNLASIDDFGHLLIESRKEIQVKQKENKGSKDTVELLTSQQLKEVIDKIEQIQHGFEDAKGSIKSVSQKNKSIRQMLEQLERDLSQL